MITFPRRLNLLLGSAVLCILAAAFACGSDQGQVEPATEISQSNILILLDTSAAMEEPFEAGTKIEAAVTVIIELVSNPQTSSLDHLALRQYGGPCGETILNFRSLSKKMTRMHFGRYSKILRLPEERPSSEASKNHLEISAAWSVPKVC